MLETTRERARTRAQEEVQRTKHSLKAELGHVLMDFLEEYFPEQARTRDRSRSWGLFVVGTLIGLYLGRRFMRRY